MDNNAYRDYLPDLTSPRFTELRARNAHEHAAAFLRTGQPPWLHALYRHWQTLVAEPYRGISHDGAIRRGIYKPRDEGIPIESIVSAGNYALFLMTPDQRVKTRHHVDSPQWRTWSNPEFLLSNKGVRLDEITPDLRTAIIRILEAALSPEGYAKALNAMKINHFLGELVKAPRIMNEFSYNFALFGKPSTTQPWGFSFYGHHLCLNVGLQGPQITIAPCFTGAEPNIIDTGPLAGTRILVNEETLGLRLMQSLAPEQQAKAQTYKTMHDPAMPAGRWNRDDQRHLCGAYRDNRVVPYEGIPVSDMTSAQQDLIIGICREYLLYLPSRSREVYLQVIRSWFHETYWGWIGGFSDDDAFYYRIQSPVIIAEFDHHSGVFLTNEEPAKFHVHTLLRMPNRGDYGIALREAAPPVEQALVWPEGQ